MTDFQNLPTVITLLIALSVAAERFVEMVKGVVPWLNKKKDDDRAEGRRRAALQGLAVVGGVAISYLSWPVIKTVIPGGTPWFTILALGLLSSGGSGFWNSILTYVTNIKELRRVAVQREEQAVGNARALPEPAEGVLQP